MSDKSVDWFARIIAILGLLVAVSTVAVPYLQNKAEKREKLSIVARTESVGGVIRLSADQEKSRAVQVSWIITLSNTGTVKLSIVSYKVAQLADLGVLYFSGLDGGASDRENRPISFPVSIDAGESISMRIHIGFLPTDEVATLVWKFYSEIACSLPCHLPQLSYTLDLQK